MCPSFKSISNRSFSFFSFPTTPGSVGSQSSAPCGATGIISPGDTTPGLNCSHLNTSNCFVFSQGNTWFIGLTSGSRTLFRPWEKIHCCLETFLLFLLYHPKNKKGKKSRECLLKWLFFPLHKLHWCCFLEPVWHRVLQQRYVTKTFMLRKLKKSPSEVSSFLMSDLWPLEIKMMEKPNTGLHHCRAAQNQNQNQGLRSRNLKFDFVLEWHHWEASLKHLDKY